MTPENSYTISVVIPTYNRRRFIGHCLDSILQQTLPVDEIILVDDGSTDGTSDWARSTYPKIKVIQKRNSGVSSARNAGIQRAKSTWIAFLDSDDVWLPQKMERQVKALRNSPSYRICHTEEKWIYDGRERPVAAAYRKKGGWIFEDCLPVCAISPSTVLLHREVFQKIGLFDESLPACEDYDLWLRITSKYPVLLVDEPLIEKRAGHDDQLSREAGLDRYRIHALQKILGQEDLDTSYRETVLETLGSKCEIYAQGAEKRGRVEEAAHIRSLYQTEIGK